MYRIISITLLLFVAVWLAACSQDAVAVAPPTEDVTQATPSAVSQGGSVEDNINLVDSLRAADAPVELIGEVTQPFFAVTGQLFKVFDGEVQVFEFESEIVAKAEAALVSPDGGSVGTSMISWMATPHFYHEGKWLVLYVGDDRAIIDLLETVLGPQFAGGPSQAPNAMVPTGRIVFTNRDTSDGRVFPGDIYAMNADGGQWTPLTDGRADDFDPAWSPDGRSIAFVSDRDGNAEIYVMNADGSTPTRLTEDGAEDRFPAWSPDGSQIAFRSDRDGNYEIYVIRTDGSVAVRLTEDAGMDTEPAWSPDGKRIAFASDRDGDFEIYVVNADGSGTAQLTRNASGDSSPAWSPSGEQIAFLNDSSGSQVYVMNADGSAPKPITTVETLAGRPTWSPDGQWIAFDAGNPGSTTWGVYAITLDGAKTLTLSPSGRPGYNHQPSWSPTASEAGEAINNNCPAATTGTRLLTNGAHGYCLLYPSAYKVEKPNADETILVIGGLLNASDPRVHIVVEKADGRSAEQMADAWLAAVDGFDVSRTSTTVGGVEAVVLDKLPGQEINRRVWFVYDGRLYQMMFSPADEGLGEPYTRMEALYALITDSFTFIPVSDAVVPGADCLEATTDTQPLTFEAHNFCILYPTGYDFEESTANQIVLYVGSLLNVEHPKVFIEVGDAGGRTAEQVADERVAEVQASMPGYTVERTFGLTVGYEPAWVLENMPGQDISRQVVFVHDGQLYSLTFVPADASAGEVYAAMEDLYTTVINSFRFLR